MPWPVHPTGFFGARGDQDTYRIERSLRFNSADSAYLNRTPASAGNRKTWTWSGWVKRGLLGSQNRSLFISNPSGTTDATNTEIRIGTSLYLDSLAVNGYSTNFRITTQVFRDPSAWYHIIVAFDTTQVSGSDRIKIYVNGTQVSSFVSSSDPTQNIDYGINQAQEHRIGYSTEYFDGYLTEINFIDGQALTPSSFGETDAITGRWKAKAYSGTYGTNGFYLKFADNSGTTSTTLGKDSSGNGNNWTPNNFSVTAGAGNDSLVDSPTNYGTDTGVGGEVRGNYCTLNPLNKNTNGTLSNGNLEWQASTTAAQVVTGTSTIIPSGKTYFELNVVTAAGLGTYFQVGIVPLGKSLTSAIGNTSGNGYSVEQNQADDIQLRLNGTSITVSTVVQTGDVLQVAVDYSTGKIWFGRNNTWYNPLGGTTGNPSAGTNETATISTTTDWFPAVAKYGTGGSYAINFGQRPFAYTAPTGFKALCTTNLPTPSIQKSSKYMDVVDYTGTGASNSISSLGFSPDLIWIKNRGGATSHAIYDTTRGTQNQLSSDTTGDAVTSSTGLTSFDASGFTIGTSTLVNTSGTQYVAWAWDEAPAAGMDVVAYTGNGANRTIAHNLGVAPKMIIVKARATASTDQGWPVYHASNTAAPETDYLLLNGTDATADLDTVWNDTAPTSSVFSVGISALVNTNNDTYIAYCFSEIEGYSKFGSYTGNGSSDGPFVWCGFRPRWVMIKESSASGNNWSIYDAARDVFNPESLQLKASTSEAEGSNTFADYLSNGFKIRVSTAGINSSGQTYIFAAFAEAPFKYARAR